MVCLDKLYTVYIHKTPNNKFYVGITSKKPQARWGYNGNGYKGQVFYSAIQKYGWDNIQHRIIATDVSCEEACYLEQRLIAILKSNINGYGYNMASGGETNKGVDRFGQKNSFFGKHHTQETKRIIGEYSRNRSQETIQKIKDGLRKHYQNHDGIWKGKKMPKEAIERMSVTRGDPVCQFTLDGTFVAWYPSCRSANRIVGTSGNHVVQACRHEPKYQTCKGYKWEYASNVPEQVWRQSRKQYLEQHGLSA